MSADLILSYRFSFSYKSTENFFVSEDLHPQFWNPNQELAAAVEPVQNLVRSESLKIRHAKTKSATYIIETHKVGVQMHTLAD